LQNRLCTFSKLLRPLLRYDFRPGALLHVIVAVTWFASIKGGALFHQELHASEIFGST
jgi:hypothetical protein